MKETFLSDNETKTDLLYYESIAKTVVNLLMANIEKPISVGIHGDWGAGKSSVLAMIEHSLSQTEKTLCLRFNGWLFQGFEDAKTVLLESIIEGIQDARPAVAEVKHQAKSLFRRIDWFKVAKKTGGLLATFASGLPIGSGVEAVADKIWDAIQKSGSDMTPESITGLIESGGDFLKEDGNENMARQIHKFREELGTLIETAGIERLVILLDDLDRCLPNTAIETLEAAKLFLFLPRIAFVVAADEGMIEYSVKQHFPDMPIGHAGASYARAYLEKLIQVPFRIPALGDVEIHAYIALLMAEAALGSEDERFLLFLNLAREKLRRPWEGSRLTLAELGSISHAPVAMKQGITLSDQLATVLARGTQGNPRQVKRFLNSLMLREAIAQARGMEAMIKRPVLAKIMLAERFHSEFYAELSIAVNLARDGMVKQLATLKAQAKESEEKGRRSKPDDSWEKWANDEAIKRWAALEPSLENEDLRPYVFVTRDRKAAFGAAGADGLDDLADLLMGPRLSIQAAKTKIAALPPADAVQVFGKLRSRILAEDSFEDTTDDGPPGFPGMVGLANAHEAMLLPLLEFLEEAPVGKLGAWALKHGINFSGGEVRPRWDRLIGKWAAQQENRLFAAAVKAMTGSSKRSN